MKWVLLLLLPPLCLSQQLQRLPPNSTEEPHETSSHLPNLTTSPSKTKINTSITPQTANTSSPVQPTTNFIKTTFSTAPPNKTVNATTAKPTTHIAVTKTTPQTVPSSSATATPKATAAQIKTSGFSVGSFIGGIVLTLVLLAIGYIGCRTYHAKRGVQYRTIDEHDAII